MNSLSAGAPTVRTRACLRRSGSVAQAASAVRQAQVVRSATQVIAPVIGIVATVIAATAAAARRLGFFQNSERPAAQATAERHNESTRRRASATPGARSNTPTSKRRN